jgi:hypothetical protein
LVPLRLLVAACALLTLVLLRAAPAAQPVQSIQRHFDPADRESGRYQYVPFDVASGTEELTISYRYSGDNGTNVIDLGLFEPGSLEIGTPAFRGYSGGAQRTITVGRNSASPGYSTGPLPPGRWHVLLGLYRVAPGGVDVTVDVARSRESRAEPAASETAARPAAPGSHPERRWYSGALHLHTKHSDGALSPAAVAETARRAGLDFIAVTDHNNTTHTREAMPHSPLHIVGEEVTTPAGHANVWGLAPGAWIDFRVRPADPGAAHTIDGFVAQAHRRGALFSINHPVDECAGCSWEQAMPDALDAIEIWNGSKGPQEPALAIWDRLLRSGRRVTAVGASDWHRAPAAIDAPVVRVLSEGLTQPSILDSIRQGRVVVVRDARIEPPSVRATCGGNHAAIGETLSCRGGERVGVRVVSAGVAGGRADLFWNGSKSQSKAATGDVRFELDAASGYLRIHLHTADGGVAAITNPIHVSVR